MKTPERTELALLPRKSGLYVLARGLDDHDPAQLVERSRDPEIRFWTPNDEKGRFKDENSVAEWAKSRHVYTVRSVDTDKMAAVAWRGLKDFPYDEYPNTAPDQPNTTVAVRAYMGKQGFGKIALGVAMLEGASLDSGDEAPADGFWLETDGPDPDAADPRKQLGNLDAIALYDKLGFEEVGHRTGRVVMSAELDVAMDYAYSFPLHAPEGLPVL